MFFNILCITNNLPYFETASATSTTLATADRMVINDNGTMVQVALSDLVTFLENGSVSGFDIDGGTY